MAELSHIISLLNNSHASQNEVVQAIGNLQKLLLNEKKTQLRLLKSHFFGKSMHFPLLGVLRSYKSDVDMFIRTASCIALLSNECDLGRDAFYAARAVPELMHVLKPKHPLYIPMGIRNTSTAACGMNRTVDFRPQEEALLALQKLVYLHEDNTYSFLRNGGVMLLIDLCHKVQYMKHGYSDQSTKLLKQLTSGRRLVAQMTKMSSLDYPNASKAFTALESYANEEDLDIYTASLRIQGGDSFIDVSEALTEAEVVWRSDRPHYYDDFDTQEDVVISHVEDAGHFWCQVFSSVDSSKLSAMQGALRRLSQAPPPSAAIPLQVGAVYVIDTTNIIDQSDCRTGWIRARLLGVTGSGRFRVLAIDYGFCGTVLPPHVHQLPKECQGIVDLARPCIMPGIKPVPRHLTILRRSIGILQNITCLQSSPSIRGKFALLNSVGIDMLFSFIYGGNDYEIVKSALAVLVNVSNLHTKKEEVVSKGAFKLMLECCNCFSEHKELIKLSLKVIQGLLYESVPNRLSLIKMGGTKEIIKLLKSYEDLDLRELIHDVLSNLTGNLVLKPTAASGPLQSDLQFAVGSLKRTGSGSVDAGYIFKDKSQTISSFKESKESPVSIPNFTTSQSLGASSDNNLPPMDAAYIHGKIFRPTDGKDHEYIFCDALESLHGEQLFQHICAFLNSYSEGIIHIGIASNRAISGIPLNRKEIDQFGNQIDQCLRKEIKPLVHPNNFKVAFQGVLKSSGKELYIIELQFMAGNLNTVYTLKRKCYIRMSKRSVSVGLQDLRSYIIQQETLKRKGFF